MDQTDFMKKGYMRLERRNTRFKMETNINASEFTESVKPPSNEEKDSKHFTDK